MKINPRRRDAFYMASDRLAPAEFVERPALARILTVRESINGLRIISNKFNQDTDARQRQAENWQKKSNVIGASTGVVSDAVSETAAGSALGDLHADPDISAIQKQAEELLRDKQEQGMYPAPATEPTPLEATPQEFIDIDDNARLRALETNARIEEARKLTEQSYEENGVDALAVRETYENLDDSQFGIAA